MGDKTALISVALVAGGLIASAHAYEQRQAYNTGVYMGKSAFRAETLRNRNDPSQDAVMETALASARIIPALVDSKALRTGFRDGWREAREARTASGGN